MEVHVGKLNANMVGTICWWCSMEANVPIAIVMVNDVNPFAHVEDHGVVSCVLLEPTVPDVLQNVNPLGCDSLQRDE